MVLRIFLSERGRRGHYHLVSLATIVVVFLQACVSMTSTMNSALLPQFQVVVVSAFNVNNYHPGVQIMHHPTTTRGRSGVTTNNGLQQIHQSMLYQRLGGRRKAAEVDELSESDKEEDSIQEKDEVQEEEKQLQQGRFKRISSRIRSIRSLPTASNLAATTTVDGLDAERRMQNKRGSRFGRVTNRVRTAYSSRKANRTKAEEPTVWVQNVHELRKEVLINRIPLKEVGFNLTNSNADGVTTNMNATTVTTEQLMHHSVLQLIAERVRTNSTPGNRAAGDTAHLALSIEGGGMRGAVSAGMAAAIASLGLTDTFDSVYGSSAGCIVGAYMISRQMCVDVYTEIMPAAGSKFASKGRVISNVGVGYVSDLVTRLREQGETTLAAAVAAATIASNSSSSSTASGTSAPIEFIRVGSDDRIRLQNLSSEVTGAPPPPAKGSTSSSSLPIEFIPYYDDTTDINIAQAIAAESQEGATLAAPEGGGRLSRAMDRLPALKKVPSALSSLRPYLTLNPGMNLTFVIDGIMSSTSGLRPFDMETFRHNDAKQPLKAVSSTVRGGKLETVAFGSVEGDFWDLLVDEHQQEDLALEKEGRIKRSAKAVKRMVRALVNIVFRTVRMTRNFGRRLSGKDNIVPPQKLGDEKESTTQLREATACPDNSGRKGLFACLESSMLVPGAAGKPLKLLRSKHRKEASENGIANNTNICFDAFAYEPMPYRSAVADGATHVLALRSRPDGCTLETKPYTYEKLVAPVYFRLNGLPQVGEFFEKGGSQYRYVEDVMTLDEGLTEGCNTKFPSKPVRVPPTEILYGTDDDDSLVVDPATWSEAYLLPVICKAGTPELPQLTQEKAEVVNAVRDGYVAAFDMLAPIAGLQFDPKTVDTRRIAEMVFPVTDDGDNEDVLGRPVQVQGEIIQQYQQPQQEQQQGGDERKRKRFARWMTSQRKDRRLWNRKASRNPFRAALVDAEIEKPGMIGGKKDHMDWLEAEALLTALPGFRMGKLPHLATGLRSSDRGRLIPDASLPSEAVNKGDDETEEYA